MDEKEVRSNEREGERVLAVSKEWRCSLMVYRTLCYIENVYITQELEAV